MAQSHEATPNLFCKSAFSSLSCRDSCLIALAHAPPSSLCIAAIRNSRTCRNVCEEICVVAISAFKAFGSLVGSLCIVPFLPLFRVKEVVDATVGGAYLFGAELWAPLIPRAGRTPGSSINKDLLSWILGLGNARLDRCRGWVELRELDDVETGMPLRAIDDAICHEGLLS